MGKVSGPERETRNLLRSIADMRDAERLQRIDALMDAAGGTPEGAELDRLVTEQQAAEAGFMDGTLKVGSIEGSRCGDPSVLSIRDHSEGQEILLNQTEARALILWLQLVLPLNQGVQHGDV